MEILEAEALKTYTLKVNGDTGELVGEYAEEGGDDAGAKLDKVVKKYAIDHNVTYNEAFHRVVQDPRHRALVRAYEES